MFPFMEFLTPGLVSGSAWFFAALGAVFGCWGGAMLVQGVLVRWFDHLHASMVLNVIDALAGIIAVIVFGFVGGAFAFGLLGYFVGYMLAYTLLPTVVLLALGFPVYKLYQKRARELVSLH